MRVTECVDCGQQVEKHGGGLLPSRCPGCYLAWQREKNRQRGNERRRLERENQAPRMMVCLDCGKELGLFVGRGRPKERCAACKRHRDLEMQRLGYHRDGTKRRAANLAAYYQKKYGLTIAERDAMLDLQGGKCAICGGGPNGRNNRLHVDHCHSSNRIRGLLCHNCNTLLGLAADDSSRLEAAAAYLRKHSP